MTQEPVSAGGAALSGPVPLQDVVLDVVRSALGRVLEVEPDAVSRQTRFADDLRVDSLALVEVVELVEQALAPRARRGFRLSDEELDALVTVGELVDLSLRRLA